MSMQEYVDRISQSIEDGDLDGAVQAAVDARDNGVDPVDFLQDGLVPVLNDLGDQFGRMEIFLPDLIFAAEVAKEIKGVLQEAILEKKAGGVEKGTIVIGTVKGDVHDIGKSMVATILEVNGFRVVDMGSDVPVFDFIQTAERENAGIIAMSSLLTTSMPYIEELIETLTALGKRDRFKIIVGGGSISAEYADRIGADGYGHDAPAAVALCERLIG